MTAQPVVVPYSSLLSQPESVGEKLEQALGSRDGSLGIVVIDGLPETFAGLREKLFILAERLANTDPEVLERDLTKPETSYLFGWSHGKEVMNGIPDLQKGSFYANPLLDVPDVSDDMRRKHAEYYSGNIWPKGVSGLEEFEQTFKALGKIIFDVGCALARACEPFGKLRLKFKTDVVGGIDCMLNTVTQHTSGGPTETVESLIKNSQCNKARLLHYYPVPPSSQPDQLTNDGLCGTHLDHSLLTGLCSAMYLSRSAPNVPPTQTKAPSSTSGLYIYPRSSSSSTKQEAVKVAIPPDCLAFQTGEALQLFTGGRLAATPHFVSGNPGTSDQGQISRETFAFFLQPDVDAVVGPDGETFGAFTKRVLSRHYSKDAA